MNDLIYNLKIMLSICIVLSSCSKNEIKILEEVDSITVKGANSDVFRYNYYFLRDFCFGNNYYIAQVSENKQFISLFDIEGVKDTSFITIPDDVRNFRSFDFDIISFDSIVFYNEHTKSVIIADATGNINFKTQLDLGDLETYSADEYVVSPTPFSNRLHYHNNLFVNHYPVQNVSDKQVRKEYYSKKLMLEIDVMNNKVINYLIAFPKYFQDEEYRVLNPHKVFLRDKQCHVYTFENDPKIYIENMSGIQSVMCKSSYHIDSKEYDEDMFEKIDREYSRKYYTINPAYYSIFYNEVQNVFYRVYCIPMSHKNEDGTINLPGDRDFTVMKLDTNFKIIEEYFFDSKQYGYVMFTPTNDGFLLRKKTENPEDDYVFARFKTE